MTGPHSYESWRRCLDGLPARYTTEYPIFTDAHITGAIFAGYGPYQFFNTTPFNVEFHVARPAIILRAAEHQPHNDFSHPRTHTNEETYHAGGPEDEVAAIVALCLGVRAEAGDATRMFGPSDTDRGTPVAYHYGREPVLQRQKPPALVPSATGEHLLDELLLPFLNFPRVQPQEAIALVRAARLYQAAMWVAETNPNQAWIQFASAVETAADCWTAGSMSPLDSLRGWSPPIAKLLEGKGEDHAIAVAKKLNKIAGATWKFATFIRTFRSEPPTTRPPPFYQLAWDEPVFDAAVKKVYEYRSRALHGGKPFPAPMCWAYNWHNNIPAEVPSGGGTGIHNWVKESLPMTLHTFEHIVRHCLLNWWKSMAAAGMTGEDQAPAADA